MTLQKLLEFTTFNTKNKEGIQGDNFEKIAS